MLGPSGPLLLSVWGRLLLLAFVFELLPDPQRHPTVGPVVVSCCYLGGDVWVETGGLYFV